MSSEKLTAAIGLIDRAEQTMQQVRTETPVGYLDDDASRSAFNQQMLSARDDLENAIGVMFSDPEEPTPEEQDAFAERNAPVRRMFSYLTVEHQEGRLPQLKEAPWPPAEWVAEDNMRADAADAEAEPATNGYQDEEVPSAQGADADAERG